MYQQMPIQSYLKQSDKRFNPVDCAHRQNEPTSIKNPKDVLFTSHITVFESKEEDD